MSRYPFEEYARRFMESMTGVYSEETASKISRRYHRMARDFRTHFESGKISTTSPKNMTPEDVKYHLLYRKGLGYSKSEYSHEVTALIVLFDFCENMAVRTCLRKYPLCKPSKGHVRLPSLEPSAYRRIEGRINEVASIESDYATIRSYAMLAVFLGCGPRTKELRFMDARDLDTEDWVLDIIHVKGEDTYGEPRSVPVPPQFRRILLRYLELRTQNNPTGSPALFPPSRGSNLYLVGNSIRKILSVACLDLGIDMNPRILRRTFGQHYLDSDIDSIESVSVLMGHASTQTTEIYYARRRNTKAIEEARRTFRTPGGSNTPTDDVVDGDEPDAENDEDGAGEGIRTLEPLRTGS